MYKSHLLGAVDVLVAVGKVALLILGLVLRAVGGNGSNGHSLVSCLGHHWGSSVSHTSLGGRDDGGSWGTIAIVLNKSGAWHSLQWGSLVSDLGSVGVASFLLGAVDVLVALGKVAFQISPP